MHPWNFWTSRLAEKLSDVLQQPVTPSEIVTPPDNKMGDFAFGCFKLAKEKRMSPAELAKQLAGQLNGLESADIAKIEAAGPYVNFTLSTSEAVHRVVRTIEIEKEGFGDVDGGKGKDILFEYAQPNTHKEIHVGHVRNLLLGVSLIRLLTKTNWHVMPVTYHGDVGAHVAKCLWWFVRQQKGNLDLTEQDVDAWLQSFPADQKTGKYLGNMYSQSSRELDAHPEYKDEVSAVQQKLEAHEPAWEKLWRETRRWSLDEMTRIFEETEAISQRQYLESEVVARGQSMVDDLLARGVAKESQGAKVVDLEDVDLGVFLVRKSDGTSLYATKDLALAELKQKEYPNVDRNIIMVDSRQGFYFKQLFETLKRMGMGEAFEFVGYEFVTLKDGAMSSREGNIVTYREFIDQVVQYAREEILKRHEDWNEGKVTDVSWRVAMAGIKFAFLKQDNDKIFTFDKEQAVAFEGATGPYCQYAAVRLSSILKKAGPFGQTATLPTTAQEPAEKRLAVHMAKFPVIVEQAGRELRPSIVAQWCHEMAQATNEFYRDVPVLDTEGDVRASRLRLAEAARLTLANGLNLLGITIPAEM